MMLNNIFLYVVNMGCQAAICVVFVLVARWILSMLHFPKRYLCYLWLIPLIRLVMPVSVPFSLSIMPVRFEVVPMNIEYMDEPFANSDKDSVSKTVNNSVNDSSSDSVSNLVNGSLSDSGSNSVNDVRSGSASNSSNDQLSDSENGSLSSKVSDSVSSTFTEAPNTPEESKIYETINNIFFRKTPGASINPMQIVVSMAADIWRFGICAILVYSVISYVMLKRKLRFAAGTDEEGVYVADNIQTAFVLGLIRTAVYLPSGLSGDVTAYVLGHEKMHIMRRDHLLKFIAYVVTVVYWGNPFAWLMYIMLTGDIELACDEAVIYKRSEDYRQQYAKALLTMAVGTRNAVLSPLAFSEGSPKKRIRVLAGYRKPALAVTMLGLMACILLGCGLLTSKPDTVNDSAGKNDAYLTMDEKTAGSQYEKESVEADKARQEEEAARKQLEENSEQATRKQLQENAAQAARKQLQETREQIENKISELERISNASDGETIEVTEPVIDLSKDWGATSPKLLYADADIIVFSGYFGLFVYSKVEDRIIRAVDLREAIGYQAQGDFYFNEYVTEDGEDGMVINTIYFVPALRGNYYYTYSIKDNVIMKYGGSPTELHVSSDDMLFRENDRPVEIDEKKIHYISNRGNGGDWQTDEWEKDGVIMQTRLGMPMVLANAGTIGGLVWRDSEAKTNDSSDFDPRSCENWRYLFPPEGYENAKWLTIEDIKDIGVSKLEMRVRGKMMQVSDTDTLEMFERAYYNCKEIRGGSGCPFDYPMYITLKDGTVGYVNPAEDSCGVIVTADGYFQPEDRSLKDKLVNKLEEVFGWVV